MATILFVVNHAGFFLSHRLPLAEAARRSGYEVHVATPPSKHVPLVREAGFAWHPLRLSRSSRNPLTELFTFVSIARLYRRLRPDLVHHVSSKPVLYGTLAARLTKVPAVVNAISGMGHVFADGNRLLTETVSFGYRSLLKHPNMRVVFQNTDHREMFVGQRWIREEEAVLIPGSGVDPEVFVPVEREASDPPTVVFPARMLTTKGLQEFVGAARVLRERGVECRYILVGEPDPDNLASVPETRLREWALDGLVERWGRRDDMPTVLGSADIVCLPSYHEGMPKSLLEASSCGIPVVATDVPGCRSAVQDGETGYLVPPRTVVELADALERLIRDPSLRARFGSNGRQRVLREFSLDRVLSDFIRLYEGLLA